MLCKYYTTLDSNHISSMRLQGFWVEILTENSTYSLFHYSLVMLNFRYASIQLVSISSLLFYFILGYFVFEKFYEPTPTLSAVIWPALNWALEAIATIVRAARIKANHFRSNHLQIQLHNNFLVQRYFDLS